MASSRNGGARRPLVEILYFDGCPNHAEAGALVERVSGELGLDLEVRLVNVTDPESAERERFLGSPTIRVDGRDVEPSTAERTNFALSCRVYRTEAGFAAQPPESSVREALEEAARPSAQTADPAPGAQTPGRPVAALQDKASKAPALSGTDSITGREVASARSQGRRS